MLRTFFITGIALCTWGCSLSPGDKSRLESAGSDNVFAQGEMYVSPRYAAEVQSSLDREPGVIDTFKKVRQVSTAYWLDSIAAVATLRPFLDGARERAQKSAKPLIVSFVIYDLPDRDCAALSSNGELKSSANGLERYKKEYIDPIAQLFADYTDLKIVAFIEPDSLANLATNLGVAKCAGAAEIYRQGVAYALTKLHEAGALLYLDSAHSGWLGWPENRRKMANVVTEVLQLAGSKSLIRGFVTNLANYSPLTVPEDNLPHGWYDRSNPAKGELAFIKLIAQDYADAGLTAPRFIVDTSRNGVVDSRQVWGSWCNVAKAGMGELPRVDPAENIDAYLWIKTPGESDGTSDPTAPRYDPTCSSADSLPDAPEAGAWFHNQFMQLVKNGLEPFKAPAPLISDPMQVGSR